MTTDRVIQLRIVFTNYEILFLEKKLNSHILTIQRHHPHLKFDIPTLKKELVLLQFDPSLTRQIFAYKIFLFNVNLIQIHSPTPTMYYTGTLKDQNRFFPHSYLVTELNQPNGQPTQLIPLQTEDGLYQLPIIDKTDSTKPTILETFSLHLSIENFQFSIAPFTNWKQTQSWKGLMSFPLTPNANHSMPSIQNPNSHVSTLANQKVSFHQPFGYYQHSPPPPHTQPLASQSTAFSHRNNHHLRSKTSILQHDSNLNPNHTDDYFDDDIFTVNVSNITSNATVDSNSTIDDQNDFNNDESEERVTYSPRERLKIKPQKGSRNIPSTTIAAPTNFNRTEVETCRQLSLIDLLCSTRAGLPPTDSGHALPQPDISTIDSNDHPVPTTQDAHLHTEAVLASKQVPGLQRSLSDSQPPQASKPPGQAYLLPAPKVPLNTDTPTSHSDIDAIPVLGQLRPPTPPPQVPGPVAPLSQSPLLSQALPRTEVTAANSELLRYSMLSHPLTISGLANDPSIPTTLQPQNRPVRETRKPVHLQDYETPSITNKQSDKKGFFNSLINRSRST